MFARRLAIGVRSSWLASATSWRCASTERSRASSVALKLRARRESSSSAAPTSMRRETSGSAATASVPLVKRPIGASAVRATSTPRRGGQRHAAGAHQREDQQDAAELLVHLGERARHLHRAAARRPRA